MMQLQWILAEWCGKCWHSMGDYHKRHLVKANSVRLPDMDASATCGLHLHFVEETAMACSRLNSFGSSGSPLSMVNYECSTYLWWDIECNWTNSWPGKIARFEELAWRIFSMLACRSSLHMCRWPFHFHLLLIPAACTWYQNVYNTGVDYFYSCVQRPIFQSIPFSPPYFAVLRFQGKSSLGMLHHCGDAGR